MIRELLSPALALTLALMPMPVAAVSHAPASAGQDTATAAELFRKGEAKFAAAEYQQAIELWTEAYALVADADDPDAALILDALIYNMAKAQLFAYRLDANPMRLKKAAASLSRQIEVLEPKADDGDEGAATALADGRALLEEIQRELEQSDPEPGPEPEPESEPAPDLDPDADPNTPNATPKPKRALLGSGAALLGIGVAGLGVMTAGLVIGSSAKADIEGWEDELVRSQLPASAVTRGMTGNTLAIVGAAVGGTLVVAGVALIVVGTKKARSRQAAMLPAPTLVRGGLGLGLIGRF